MSFWTGLFVSTRVKKTPLRLAKPVFCLRRNPLKLQHSFVSGGGGGNGGGGGDDDDDDHDDDDDDDMMMILLLLLLFVGQ